MCAAPRGGLPRKEAFAIHTASVTIPSRPDEWRQDAACAGIDVDLFYGTRTDQAQALLICRQCPVTEACLWSAMLEEAGERYRFGVRGCTLPVQRYRLARILGQDELQSRLAAAVAACDARKGAAA